MPSLLPIAAVLLLTGLAALGLGLTLFLPLCGLRSGFLHTRQGGRVDVGQPGADVCKPHAINLMAGVLDFAVRVDHNEAGAISSCQNMTAAFQGHSKAASVAGPFPCLRYRRWSVFDKLPHCTPAVVDDALTTTDFSLLAFVFLCTPGQFQFDIGRLDHHAGFGMDAVNGDVNMRLRLVVVNDQ